MNFLELVNQYAAERQTNGKWSTERRLLAALTCQPTDVLSFCLPSFDLFRWSDERYDELLPAIAHFTDPIYEVALTFEPLAAHPLVSEGHSNGNLARHVSTPLGPLTEIIRPAEDGSSHAARAKWWIETPEDAERFLALPLKVCPRDLAAIQDTRARLGPNALTIISCFEPLQCVHDLVGTERLCLWSATEPGLLRRLLDAVAEGVMTDLEQLLAAGLGPVYRVADSEMAIPPLMSIRQFERFSFPYLRAMADAIHAAGQKMILHCHGNVHQLLERFVDTGADGTDPYEPPPIGGVDLAEAQQRVGGRLSLWGNLEYDVLSEAGEDEVARLTRTTIAAGASGRGFVLIPSCRLYEKPLPRQTCRNLLRVIEVARAYRG